MRIDNFFLFSHFFLYYKDVPHCHLACNIFKKSAVILVFIHLCVTPQVASGFFLSSQIFCDLMKFSSCFLWLVFSICLGCNYLQFWEIFGSYFFICFALDPLRKFHIHIKLLIYMFHITTVLYSFHVYLFDF